MDNSQKIIVRDTLRMLVHICRQINAGRKISPEDIADLERMAEEITR